MDNNSQQIQVLDAYGKEVKKVSQQELDEMKKANQPMVQLNETTVKQQIKLNG
jgi:hypothetical protein